MHKNHVLELVAHVRNDGTIFCIRGLALSK